MDNAVKWKESSRTNDTSKEMGFYDCRSWFPHARFPVKVWAVARSCNVMPIVVGHAEAWATSS